MRDTKRPIQCLLITDDNDLQKTIPGLLGDGTRAQYALEHLDNLDDALERMISEQIEVCLVDYRLDEESGCDLIRRAKLQGITAPFVMFTESEDDAIDVEAVMAGASDLLALDELTDSLLERTIHVALVRSLADARLRRMATRDHLTKVFNRAHFERFAANELLRSNRCDQKAALMFIDVDKFKQVNDTFGHATGDDMLKTVAQICQNEIRAIDCVARFGGDEFVIMLLQSGVEGGCIVAERIRAGIDGAILRREYDAVPVSVSVGIASTEQGFTSYTPLLEAADVAAMHAKEQGRNRVVTWEAWMEPPSPTPPDSEQPLSEAS